MENRILRMILLTMVITLPASAALSSTCIDTLEDIGRDGTPVTVRNIDICDVTVSISNSGSAPLAART